ncbi:MAG: hypothetical protein WA417_22270 [Stellaceae bacterium]|jgi:hypothetical protein
MKRMLIRGIDAADVVTELGALGKLNADCDNLSYLMKVGRERADAWRQKNFCRLGKNRPSTLAISTSDRDAAVLAPGENPVLLQAR